MCKIAASLDFLFIAISLKGGLMVLPLLPEVVYLF